MTDRTTSSPRAAGRQRALGQTGALGTSRARAWRGACLGGWLALLAACGHSHPPSPAVREQTAEDAIEAFHAHFDAGDYAAIWTQADDGFRKSVPRADYEAFMQRAHARLGHVLGTVKVSAASSRAGARETLLVTQSTRFEHGAGVETFTFLIKKPAPLLIGYNLQAPLLATR